MPRSRWAASNCYDYDGHEAKIGDKHLLDSVRLLIDLHFLFQAP